MRSRLPVWSLVGWTLFVWVGRIRNILTDDDLSSGGRAWRLAAALFFVLLALAVGVTRRSGSGRADAVLGLLAAWTIGWWGIRGVAILLDDHDLGFTIVHTILMLVSIGLAMWAWRRRDG